MSSIIDILNDSFSINILSNATWDVIKTLWKSITHKDWEDLYWDSFQKAVNDNRKVWGKYISKNGIIEFNHSAFDKVLHQEIKTDIISKSLSYLIDDQFCMVLSEIMAREEVLSLEGHFLSREDYHQIIRNLVSIARENFKQSLADRKNGLPALKNINKEFISLQQKADISLETVKEVYIFLHNHIEPIFRHIEKIDDRLGEIEHTLDLYTFRPTLQIPPMQKPIKVSHFIGREVELGNLLNNIKPGKVVTLCGPGGVGKSALAAEAIWRLAPDSKIPDIFPDGILNIDFYENPNIQHAFEWILKSYDKNIKDTSADAVKLLLDHKTALLFLEGAEQTNELPKLLKICANCGVLVTTRLVDNTYTDVLELKPFNEHDSIRLLKAWGGKRAYDEKILKEILKIIGGLPMALRLVGAQISHSKQTAEEYLISLKKDPLKALDLGTNRMDSVPVLLEKSINLLDEDSRIILSIIGYLAPTPFFSDVLAAATKKSINDINRILGTLVSNSLLDRINGQHKVSHVLIHIYLHENRKIDYEFITRLAKYYAEFIAIECNKGYQGYRRLDKELSHITKIIEDITNFRNNEYFILVINLVNALEDYIKYQSNWDGWEHLLKNGLIAAKSISEKTNVGKFMGDLGIMYHSTGQLKKAMLYHEHAIEYARQIGDKNIEACNIGYLGDDYFLKGEIKNAIKCYTMALLISNQTGNMLNIAYQLSNLGNAYLYQSKMDLAIVFFDKALRISRVRGFKQYEIRFLENLGRFYRYSLDGDKAIDYYKQAISLSKENGDLKSEGYYQMFLCRSYCEMGELDKAIICSQIAQDIYNKM